MEPVLDLCSDLSNNESVWRAVPVLVGMVISTVFGRVRQWVFRIPEMSRRAKAMLDSIQNASWNWEHETAGPVRIALIKKQPYFYVANQDVTATLTKHEKKKLYAAWCERQESEKNYLQVHATEVADEVLGIA